MVTLFRDDQEIDEAAMRKHTDFLIKKGVHSLFVLSSIGEFAYLSQSEKKQVVEIVADQLDGKRPLLVGISSPSTKLAIDLGKYAEKVGANAVMAVIPTYFLLDKANIELHYEKIAAEIELPLYAYNFPITTRIDLSPKLVAKLAEKNVLKGIKETVTDIEHVKQIIKLTPDDFCVICGTELLLKMGLEAGVDGAILGLGNCIPALLIQLWNAFKENDKRFEELWAKFTQFLPYLNQPIDYLPSLIKEILVLLGRNINPQVRGPLRTIKERMRHKLQKLELSEKL